MKKSLLALAFAAAFAGSASAAMQSVDAGNYTFTYDDSFWGIAQGTVFGQSGNTFTFSNLGYSAAAAGQRSGESSADFLDWTYVGAVSVLAKSGYQIQSIISGAVGQITTTVGSADGAYAYAGSDTYAQWNGASDIYSDTSTYSEKDGSDSFGANGPYNVSGSANLDGVQQADLTYFQTSGWVTVAGRDSSASISHDASYFTVQVSAVPEADSYAMLLAGLGVIGALVRRRAKQL
ncbi:MAG: PEP-CTERM sorting domain-containing protein [Ferribacterium limneticum]